VLDRFLRGKSFLRLNFPLTVYREDATVNELMRRVRIAVPQEPLTEALQRHLKREYVLLDMITGSLRGLEVKLRTFHQVGCSLCL
jgi:hypothetical protein